MDCPVCKAPLEGSPKFCARCGSAIDAIGSSATSSAPSTEVDPRYDPFLGQTVGGRYKITKLLGEGGMGAVYVGEQNIGGTVRKVAIKTLHAHLSKDPKILQRFERECATVAELQHPNTIQLYDFGKTDDGILYMVMEFVQGESLAAVLEKKKSLEPPRAQHILQQICDALGEAHSLGIVHRDLKPDNIVLTERAKDWVKVLDFGIAKRSEAPDKEEQKLTQQGTVLGTPPYMSPEQFTGRPVDARSDIYSIAIIAYEMVAGRLPFAAATPWEWATQHMTAVPQALTTTPSGGHVPDSMIYAIMRSLAKDPAERFASTKEFFDALAFSTDGMSGGYSVAPSSALATGAAAAMIAPAALAGASPMPGATATPPQAPAGGTQLAPPPGAPQPYGPPGGAPPYVPAQGTAPVPAMPVQAAYGSPAVGAYGAPPNATPRRGRSSGGGVLAVLAVVGLLGVGGIVFALTRSHRTSGHKGSGAPSATPAVADNTADAGENKATDDAGPEPVATDTHRHHGLPPLIDTALPSLPSGNDTHLSHHAADSGAGPAPNPAPNPNPSPPANESKDCRNARSLQARIAQDPSPSPKMLARFAKDRAKCFAEGGHF